MKQKKTAFSSPLGVARYPWLTEPDTAFGQEKFKCDLILSPEDAKPLIEQVNKVAGDFGAMAGKASLPYFTDEDTGDVIFRTKTTYKPKFFDSAGDPIIESKVPPIWGGSKLKLGGWIAPWSMNGKCGITLQLMKCMIVEAKGPTEGGSANSGFEPVEGGFVAEKEESFEEAPSDAPSYL